MVVVVVVVVCFPVSSTLFSHEKILKPLPIGANSLAAKPAPQLADEESFAWFQNLIRCEDGEEISATELSNKLIGF